MKKPKKPKKTKPSKKRRSAKGLPQKKKRAKHVWLNVLPDDLWLKFKRGITVWEAMQRANLELDGDCGGLGKCGKCRIKVLSSIREPTEDERQHLDEEELQQGIRLACRTEIRKDMAIHVREPELEEEYYQILTTGHWPLVFLEPLIDKRLVTLPPDSREEGLSDLDRIKMVLGPEHVHLTASIHCLRTLPDMLKKTGERGAAVLHDNHLIAWQDWEEVGRRYGLVFDLGTSTLVGKLISLLDGSIIASVSRLNGQYKYGTNVISRLQYIQEHPRGLEKLHKVLLRDLNAIASHLLKVGGLKREDIFIAVAAGNTTMQHLLLTLNPMGIAEAPFSPVLTDGMAVNAREVGLELHPEALLYVMPTKSGYIGGDLISVILVSEAFEKDEIVLGLDFGTNGEIFLGNRSRLMTCSAAAGPALEGSRISCGMIAKAGAIEGVNVEEGDFRYRIIGNIRPKGLCGSGLVDLIAALLHSGVVDDEGRILSPDECNVEGLSDRLVERGGAWNFMIAGREESYTGRRIFLTQKDVRELQLPKAAIAAGIKTLMDEMGVGISDISHIYLAGALGNYINPYSAMRVGLIPRVDPEIIVSLGNAASTGASMALLSKTSWYKASELAHFIEHIELSSRLDFNEYFIDHMDFPRANIW